MFDYFFTFKSLSFTLKSRVLLFKALSFTFKCLGFTFKSISFTFKSPEDAPVDETYEDIAKLSDRAYLFAMADARQKRTAHEKAFVTAKPEMNALRALDKREAKTALKRKLERTILFRVGENATALEYPHDVARLTLKTGRTYNPRTEKHERRPFSDYAEGRLHMEVVLVLWGVGGRGKTQSARCSFACREANWACQSLSLRLRWSLRVFRLAACAAIQRLAVRCFM